MLAQFEEWGRCQRLGKEVGEHIGFGYMLDVDRFPLDLVGKVMVAQVYEFSALRWAVVFGNLYC